MVGVIPGVGRLPGWGQRAELAEGRPRSMLEELGMNAPEAELFLSESCA